MKILGTGLTGLVGSRIVELLSEKEYEFENISRSSGVDIANRDQVLQKITDSSADVVLHLAAKADVDGCEKDKELGQDGEAWKINVEGTRHIADACVLANKKLIYISTDFVFDGEREDYREGHTPHPINWYGQTKYEGEKIVSSLATPWIIARISYPYRFSYTKNDFLRAVKGKLEKGERVTMVVDHVFTPTFIDDIANALDRLIMQDAKGTYHIAGSSSLTPCDAAKKIADEFGYSRELIGEITREEFFKDRATRPFRLAIKSDKIGALGIHMRSFDEGLAELKSHMTNSK